MENLNKYKILLIEDSNTDAYVIKKLLNKNMGIEIELSHVASMEEAENFMSLKDHSIHIILLDLGLPDTKNGQEGYQRTMAMAPDIPVIILTGEEDHQLAISLVDDGAEDYVRKMSISKQPKRLCDAIDFSICRHRRLVDVKKKAEESQNIISWMSGSYSA